MKKQQESLFFDYDFLYIIIKKQIMKRKEDDKKRKTISITIDRNLYNIIEQNTNNKSMYISWMLVEKLKELNIDVSNVKL